MKTLSVKLPSPLAGWLSRRAKELGRTQSDLVRQALEQQREENFPKEHRSCAELMDDLGGTFEGPPDLSVNPKYLEGFGE
jgi:hypothetical protein